jgi:hypothetical protein
MAMSSRRSRPCCEKCKKPAKASALRFSTSTFFTLQTRSGDPSAPRADPCPCFPTLNRIFGEKEVMI